MTDTTRELPDAEVASSLLSWWLNSRASWEFLDASERNQAAWGDLRSVILEAGSNGSEVLAWWLAKHNGQDNFQQVSQDAALRELLLATIPTAEVVAWCFSGRDAEAVLAVVRENKELQAAILGTIPETDVLEGLAGIIDLEVFDHCGVDPEDVSTLYQINGRYAGVRFCVNSKDERPFTIRVGADSEDWRDASREVYSSGYKEYYDEPWMHEPVNDHLWQNFGNEALSSILTVRRSILHDMEQQRAAEIAAGHRVTMPKPRPAGRGILD